MKNLTLITSVIDTPNLPFSYSNCRSIFNKQERFEQTKKTILSIREKIPNNKIFLIECSYLSDEEKFFFQESVDYFFNIYDTNNKILIDRMFSISKSMGDGTMTIVALQYLIKNNITFDNFFKISGRYWLNDLFDYSLYENIYSNVLKINNNNNNMFTCFYKLSSNIVYKWLEYLIQSETDLVNCIGYEIIFSKFINITINNNDYKIIEFIQQKIGINGYVAVCGSFIDM